MCLFKFKAEASRRFSHQIFFSKSFKSLETLEMHGASEAFDNSRLGKLELPFPLLTYIK
jgi:hypothetical protein